MILDELKAITFFQNLTDQDLEQLAKIGEIRRVSEGEVLFKEGESADALYVVLDGKVALYRDAVGKPTHLLDRVAPGDIFGEVGLFDDGQRTSSAQASEESRVLYFDRRNLLAFVEAHSFLALKLQMAAARRHSTNVVAALDMGRRDVVRIKVGQQIVLTTEGGHRQLAVLENLSQVGLCLSRVPEDWKAEQELEFTISKGHHSLDLHGRVAWRRGQAVGIAFLSRTPELDALIQETLRHMLDQS